MLIYVDSSYQWYHCKNVGNRFLLLKVWSKSQNLYKGSLHESSTEIKMDASADKLLLDRKYYQIIANRIIADVRKWREDSRLTSKY